MVRGEVLGSRVHAALNARHATYREGGERVVIECSWVHASNHMVDAAAVVRVGGSLEVGGARVGASSLLVDAALKDLSPRVEVERAFDSAATNGIRAVIWHLIDRRQSQVIVRFRVSTPHHGVLATEVGARCRVIVGRDGVHAAN